MKNIVFLLMFLSTAIVVSCKGDQGDPGPAGVMGQDGIDGNTNIKSFQTTVLPSDWVPIGVYYLYSDILVPIITDEIANNGLVMVYGQHIGSPNWIAWPLSTGTMSFLFLVKPSTVTLRSESTVGDPFTFPDGLNVRIIAATADGLAHNPDLDWSDYEAVKVAFDLAY